MPYQFTPNLTTARMMGETPSGTIDGSNGTFTLVNTPASGGIQLTLEGRMLSQGVEYNLSGKTITFVEGCEPTINEKLLASYYF